jgi:hypothetical protein
MMTEAEIKELLARKTETKNLDCKESLDWSTASNDDKCELVKDILAFVNTQDGGCILIGIRDDMLDLVGLGDDAFSSFDTTKVNDFLQKYTDPPTSCEVQKLTVDGFKIIAITVPEFKDIPIICKKDANSSKDPKRLILRAGGLYVRTDKATSVLVPTSEEMRDLMNRALLKRGDQLLSTIEALLKGTPKTASSVQKDYAREINEALEWFKGVLPPDFESKGFWQLRVRPDMYRRDRIPDKVTLWKAVTESEVSLRGWNFPHTDRQTQSNFSNGRQSYTNQSVLGEAYVEGFRAYQSGLFIWRGAYRENALSFTNQYGKALSFVNVIYEITEMFVFMKRYYERVAPEAIVLVSIEMNDINGRALIATGDAAPFLDPPVSRVPNLLIEESYTVDALRTSAEELAIKIVQNIFGMFNWNSPDPSMIRLWQQRLLSRTF